MDDDPIFDLPPDARGLPVLDVNGTFVGRVSAIEPGALDVALRGRVARKLHAPEHLHVPLREVIDADDHAVTLREEAAYLARPETRPRDADGA